MSKSKESAAVSSVLAYMMKQNRPYSVQDVFQNMGKDFGKTAVMKAMESLTSEGKLVEKVYGKQKVYAANQSQFPVVDDAEIKKMDAKITQLNGAIQLKSDETRKLESELQIFNNLITTDEARRQLSQIYPEISKLKEKLSKLKEGRVLISKEEKEQVYKGREKYVKEWRKRKRIASDILGSILEGYPKTKKQLFEDIGIETDEDYNVKPPDL
ncbi:homologous-pairing protein 2 homolog [Plakobranchus ocellatus]|uniref:Homologous-pairing protein 2 homolog n=1 Tax=Plakobranchus ocellatus TaxID=259542 RepID=A0AAV3ZT24_9GAST|nr:homologous-pairing protein 2 homolog [Plakobranchus ocellatus]